MFVRAESSKMKEIRERMHRERLEKVKPITDQSNT